MHSCEVLSAGPQDTAALGRALAGELTAGDVVLLVGELASGKTTFVKAVADALGYCEPVTSPTFTLANFYPAPELTLLHLDTYRLHDKAEFHDLGLADFMPEAATLIEWGDLVDGEFPDTLRIMFTRPGPGETPSRPTDGQEPKIGGNPQPEVGAEGEPEIGAAGNLGIGVGGTPEIGEGDGQEGRDERVIQLLSLGDRWQSVIERLGALVPSSGSNARSSP